MFTAPVGQWVVRDNRQELFAPFQEAPISSLDSTPAGRLVTRVTNDAEALREFFTAGVVADIGDLFTRVTFGVGVILFQLRPDPQ